MFLSSGSHERPFIGKIDFLWEAWVRWGLSGGVPCHQGMGERSLRGGVDRGGEGEYDSHSLRAWERKRGWNDKAVQPEYKFRLNVRTIEVLAC